MEKKRYFLIVWLMALVLCLVFFTCENPAVVPLFEEELPDGLGEGDGIAGDQDILFLHFVNSEDKTSIWEEGGTQWFSLYNGLTGSEYTLDYEGVVDDPDLDLLYSQDVELLLHYLKQSGSLPYKYVLLKASYPASDVVEDTGNPNFSTSVKSIDTYMVIYQIIKAELLKYPDTHFIIWTGISTAEEGKGGKNSTRSDLFFDWLKNEWDEPGDTIHIWDIIPEDYDAPKGKKGAVFSTSLLPVLFQRVVDIVEGSAD